MLSGALSLRAVEALTDEMGPMGRRYVSRRVPDTTLWNLLPRLSVPELRAKHRRQVRAFWRAKSLEPEGLPCGVVSFDGKGLGALEHDADGDAQKGHRQDGSPYWLSRMLRAVLTSCGAKPCLDQIPIGAKTNEVATFADFFDDILAAYDALFEIVTGDAGLTSKANADRIHAKNKAYVLALKDNQPELLAEARRLLLPCVGQTPDAEIPWEPAGGKLVQRRLYRTDEIAGYHGWEHLQQAWLVEQLTRDKDGTVTVEHRFFLTNLRRGRLSPSQILLVVRGHWGIENDCFWTLDTQWKEDAVPWCASGKAVEVVSWLRLGAYNLLQLARKRHLRPRDAEGKPSETPPWRRIFEWVRQALRLDLAQGAALATNG
jgi:predicted transposase YbfD/YdcC